MEKADKGREFSVRETKLDKGQVKLKLAVLPVPKRDQLDKSSTDLLDTCGFNRCAALGNLPAQSVIPSDSINATSSTPGAPVDRGKWRPIGFTPVESTPAVDTFSQHQQSSMALSSSSDRDPFFSYFGASSSSSNLFFDSGPTLKPFQVASVVATVTPSTAAHQLTFVSPVNQLYRCVPSAEHSGLNLKNKFYSKGDRLVSSGSESEELSDIDEDGKYLALYSSMTSSSASHPEAPVAKSKLPKPAPRRKQREIDSLLNTWNVAPTAGKLLRQGKIQNDSDRRSSRRAKTSLGTGTRSCTRSPTAGAEEKVTPEKKSPPAKKTAVTASTSKTEEPSRPAVTIEQIETLLGKLSKLIVSPEIKHRNSDQGKSASRSSSKSYSFLSSLLAESMPTISRKRYCSSALVSQSESSAETVAQLPPKKRHKQITPTPANLSKSPPFDSTLLSKLVERQTAAIAFLRPSLFDLKKEHDERQEKFRLAAFNIMQCVNATTTSRESVQKNRNVQGKKSDKKSTSPVAVNKDATPSVAKDPEHHPLKLRISLSKIFASRQLSHVPGVSTERNRGRKPKRKMVSPTLPVSVQHPQSKRNLSLQTEAVSSKPPAKNAGYGLRHREPVTASTKKANVGINLQEPQEKSVSLRASRRKSAEETPTVNDQSFSAISAKSPKKISSNSRPARTQRTFNKTTTATTTNDTEAHNKPLSEITKRKAVGTNVKNEAEESRSLRQGSMNLRRSVNAASTQKEKRIEKTGQKLEQSLRNTPAKNSLEKSTKVQAEGKLVLRRMKLAKHYQLTGLFCDTFKEEKPLAIENPSGDASAERVSPLGSPKSEISDPFSPSSSSFFSPINSPHHESVSSSSKCNGAVLPLPPPAALSTLYERSYFKLPHDLWLLNKHGLLNRPTHPGENFKRVRNNIYTAASRYVKAEFPEPCCCKLADEKICVDDCINKQLFVECSAESCPCFEKCSNRRFQNGCDFSKISRFETAQCGSGIKAKKQLKKGEFVVEYTGEVVTEREFRRRMTEWYASDEHHYAFNLDSGLVIDAYRMGSLARFVNHSCEPNCQMQKWTVLGYPRVGLFALKNIAPGEELSYDYNFNWFDEGSRQVCKCGKSSCRGYIGAAVPRRNSMDSLSSVKKPIQPLAKWRLANRPRLLSLRDAQIIASRHVLLRRNIRSMARKLARLIAKRKRRTGVVIAQASADGLVCSNGSVPNNHANTGNSLFMAQFKALSSSRSVSTRRLSEAETSSASKSVDMALFLEQLLTSLQMHRDSQGNQTAAPFITLPRRKQCMAYYDRIAKPIDFSTIERNITAGRYLTFDSFNDDVRLLLDNIRVAGDLLLPPEEVIKKDNEKDKEKDDGSDNGSDRVSATFYELADTYDKLLCGFKNEISEFRRLFPSAELEDVVRCICGRVNEEGTMVQCEKCQLWQHTDCVGVNVQAIPDSYMCYSCSGKTLSKEVPIPPGQYPPDAQPNCRYYHTLLTKTGLQVGVDECYTINRQSLPFDVPFCNIDKLYQGIFYVDKLYVDEKKNRKFIYGVHLVYPFEVHVDNSKRFYPNEVLATLWYDKLPIEIISKPCSVLDSTTFARGRPRSATSEELVFICDNGLDKHAKVMHKLPEPMATVCTKRFCFDYFLVPLRPERTMTAGEIHEKMFATRRVEVSKPRMPSTSDAGSQLSSPSSVEMKPFEQAVATVSDDNDEDDELPLAKLNTTESARKRERLNTVMAKLADKVSLHLPATIPHWLLKPLLTTALNVSSDEAKHEEPAFELPEVNIGTEAATESVVDPTKQLSQPSDVKMSEGSMELDKGEEIDVEEANDNEQPQKVLKDAIAVDIEHENLEKSGDIDFKESKDEPSEKVDIDNVGTREEKSNKVYATENDQKKEESAKAVENSVEVEVKADDANKEEKLKEEEEKEKEREAGCCIGDAATEFQTVSTVSSALEGTVTKLKNEDANLPASTDEVEPQLPNSPLSSGSSNHFDFYV